MHTTHHPAHSSDSRCHPCTKDGWGDLEPARYSARCKKAPRPALQLTLQHRTENWSRSGAVVRATKPSSSQKQQPVSWVQQAAWSNAHFIYLPHTCQHPLCGTGTTEVWLFWILHIQWTRMYISKNDTGGHLLHLSHRAVADTWLAQDGRQRNLLFPTFGSIFQPEVPSQRESHFLRVRAIHLPSASPPLSPVFTVIPNSWGLNSVTLKSSTYSEALPPLLTQGPSAFRRETRRAQSQENTFRNNFSCWLKAAECFVLQLRIISSARKEIKIVIPSS